MVPFPLFLWFFLGGVINSMPLHQLQCLCMCHWWHGDVKGLNETSWGLCYGETIALPFDKQSCQEHPLYSWSLCNEGVVTFCWMLEMSQLWAALLLYGLV